HPRPVAARSARVTRWKANRNTCGRFSMPTATRREPRGRPPSATACRPRNFGGPLMAVENALVLAAVRRLVRPADAPPLGTIRSLAYFLPVIEEVLEMRVSPDYFQHVRRKLERIARDR